MHLLLPNVIDQFAKAMTRLDVGKHYSNVSMRLFGVKFSFKYIRRVDLIALSSNRGPYPIT